MPVTRGTNFSFRQSLTRVGGHPLLLVPEGVSRRLPSRGQAAIRGVVNGVDFSAVLEPDGRRGHWLRIDSSWGINPDEDAQEDVDISFEVSPEWPEPDVPPDLARALLDAPDDVRETWADITPMARWEWVRWVNATANVTTRERRIVVSLSKMADGKRRPCCFDLSACTDVTVSSSGKLRQPD